MNLHAVNIEPPASVRRAALALHALGGADRAWVLGQLPPDQRERLQPLLRELADLGIPADRSLLADVLDAQPKALHPSRVDAPADDHESGQDGFARKRAALSRLEAGRMAALLQTEPAGLIAQLLHAHAWPWRQAVLEQLGAVKRRRVEEALDGLRRQMPPAVPQALHGALVDALHLRVMDTTGLAEPDAAAAGKAEAFNGGGRSGWFAAMPARLRARFKGRA